MIRVDVYETVPIYLEGLVTVLDAMEFAVRAAARTPDEARGPAADVFLVDPRVVPRATLPEFVTTASRSAPVLLLVPEADAESKLACLRTGARGLVERRASTETMVLALRTVAGGGQFWRARSSPPPDEAPDAAVFDAKLSPREQQVLGQIARGLTHGQVANRLGISRHTVDTYVKRIRSKIEVGNKADLTRIAMLSSLLGDH